MCQEEAEPPPVAQGAASPSSDAYWHAAGHLLGGRGGGSAGITCLKITALFRCLSVECLI